MCSLECLKVDLKGLKDDETSLVFDLDDTYFGALDEAEVKKGSLHVSVSIRKASGFFEFLIHAAGTVIIPCDRCLDDMEQPVDTDVRQVVRLGSENSEDGDTLVVAEDEGILDLTWIIYESVALAIPIRHVHAPGKCWQYAPTVAHIMYIIQYAPPVVTIAVRSLSRKRTKSLNNE